MPRTLPSLRCSPSLPWRPVARATSALLGLCFVLGSWAPPAQAEEGFRYWNYHHLTAGAWEFSQVGAAGYQPKDGAVEGYRFGATPNSDKNGLPPRADLDEVSFESVCGGEQAPAGDKRVAVVIDYGVPADADGEAPADPRAGCAVVDTTANGQQALAAVADVRTQDGLVCAIDGHPVSGCGEPVSDVQVSDNEQPVAFELPGAEKAAAGPTDESAADPAASTTDQDSDLLWPAVGVAVLAGLIGAGAFALNRRRNSA
ncbi:MAG: hypothetical protein AVDCRST_MAG72-2227 [uncultured Nocardioidaceae bacterium]|uniref:Secreted protein n=1 Tax=uncultured Nocardioidaceae bacterium TaxID=253824 RepID=A0A6J4ML61_9ACTN|nr:MAG: hypothetical protein AVDCRST_MAG72-2227 [uncultured Nocardioidaceae bacterium]